MKTASALGIALLVGALAIRVFGSGPGWGRGYPGSDDWGGGRDSCGRYGDGYGEPALDAQEQLNGLCRAYVRKTADLKDRVRARSAEMDAILASVDPDLRKAEAIRQELTDLKGKIADIGREYEVRVRKLTGTYLVDRKLSGAHPGGKRV